MTREEHVKRAEALAGKATRLLNGAVADSGRIDHSQLELGAAWARVALVYATLAGAPVTPLAAPAPAEDTGLRFKDCTIAGRPIPNTDGTPNKYAVPGQDQIEATLGRYDDQDPHVDGCLCPVCAPVPSDGPGQ